MLICSCLIYWFSLCKTSPAVRQFVERHIIADDPFDARRPGPWGMRPEDPDEWNDVGDTDDDPSNT